jgi:hypothetical protein
MQHQQVMYDENGNPIFMSAEGEEEEFDEE